MPKSATINPANPTRPSTDIVVDSTRKRRADVRGRDVEALGNYRVTRNTSYRDGCRGQGAGRNVVLGECEFHREHSPISLEDAAAICVDGRLDIGLVWLIRRQFI